MTEYLVSSLKNANHKNIIFKNQNEMIRKNDFVVEPTNALFKELVIFSQSILHNTKSVVDVEAAKTALEIALLIQKKKKKKKT